MALVIFRVSRTLLMRSLISFVLAMSRTTLSAGQIAVAELLCQLQNLVLIAVGQLAGRVDPGAELARLLLHELQQLRAKIAADPTGEPFNSVMAIELHGGKPLNPLVNAGAMATVSLVNGALAAVVRNDDDTISYEPLEQGVYSKGGYTIDKVSHPTLGAGEVDGILTGDLQDRGQSYSWSMAEAGDYVYIGTCYNSTYYIYHNNVKTSLDAMKKEGKLDQNVDTSRAAADFVKVMFGTDTFDETPMSQWTPVIMAVNRYTGEAQ